MKIAIVLYLISFGLIQKKQKIKADEKQQPFQPLPRKNKSSFETTFLINLSVLNPHIFPFAPPSFALLMLLFFKGHCSAPKESC
jgi:hypothetical protein